MVYGDENKTLFPVSRAAHGQAGTPRTGSGLQPPAYSGDNEHLAYAVDSGRFRSIETSVNLVDQWNLRSVLGRDPPLGVIAKRPIANAPGGSPSGRWATTPSSTGSGCGSWTSIRVTCRGTSWRCGTRRTRPGVHCAITGTSRLSNLLRNVEIVEKGPLPDEVLARIDARVGSRGVGLAELDLVRRVTCGTSCNPQGSGLVELPFATAPQHHERNRKSAQANLRQCAQTLGHGVEGSLSHCDPDAVKGNL